MLQRGQWGEGRKKEGREGKEREGWEKGRGEGEREDEIGVEELLLQRTQILFSAPT